jgi:hypothetical protein
MAGHIRQVCFRRAPRTEYDPEPPIKSGHPDRAPDGVKRAVFPRYESVRVAFRDGLARAPMM